ncbi:hypothetical protein [Ferdinandcohnia sp. SAFN-114]|uniref:hypothetical protein n=1 Tax=Ferdinandcohnia sp. SAFN-114 TaxID=3387275 RepID=UPI003F81D2A1
MKHRFVLLRTSVIEVECPCTKCEGMKKIEVKKGTILTITPDRKYVDNLGWYVLIDFDDKFQVYINIHDFEKYYFENMFCSFIDLDLKLNYLEYKLNESLDERNEEAFHLLSNELMDLNELREKIIRSMSIHYEV